VGLSSKRAASNSFHPPAVFGTGTGHFAKDLLNNNGSFFGIYNVQPKADVALNKSGSGRVVRSPDRRLTLVSGGFPL
jgi:hypothetical protein